MSAETTEAMAPTTENPFWDAVSAIPADDGWGSGNGRFTPQWSGKDQPGRRELCKTYAWAIPDPDSLAFIVDVLAGRALVEIGAGTGYWAWQLSQLGVDVIAYDNHPPNVPGNDYFVPEPRMFHKVRRGSHLRAAKHPDRVLFLCWPTMSNFATRAVRNYAGDTVIYIGEGPYGCTADESFFDELAKSWTQVGEYPLVQWSGIHDHINVWQRGSAASSSVGESEGSS